MHAHPVTQVTATPGPTAHFSGPVWVEALSPDAPTAETTVLRVTFTPGARTAWHAHPHEQVLVVTLGRGSLQRRGEPPRVMRAGDTFVIPANEEHWHGAAPDSLMQHLAIQPAAPLGATVWRAHVSDADTHPEPSRAGGEPLCTPCNTK